MSKGAVARFIRVRGRIVPIFKRGAEGVKKTAKAHVAGFKRVAKKDPGGAYGAVGGFAFTGGSIGGITAAVGNQKKQEQIRKEMSTGPQVDSKAFAKKTGYKDVTVLTSAKDVMKDRGLTDMEKRMLGAYVMPNVERGENAFAFRSKSGRDYIGVKAKAREGVVAHELGHISQYRDGKRQSGLFPRLLGGQARFEKDAWKRAKTKDKGNELEKVTYGTYKRSRDHVRAGFVGGALGAATWIARMGLR